MILVKMLNSKTLKKKLGVNDFTKDELETLRKCMVICRSLKNYPQPPQNQSHTKIDCPKCKNPMWLSQTGKGHLLFNAVLGIRDIWLSCEECI